MRLDAQTLRNLEVLTTTEGGGKGSLLWLLSRSHTTMGARALRQWLLQPLLRPAAVEARLQAVADLSSHAGVPPQFVSRSILLRRRPFSPQRESVFARQVPLTQLLQSKSLPDLERGLQAAHYGKLQPAGCVTMLRGLRAAADALPPPDADATAAPPCDLLRELFPPTSTTSLRAWLSTTTAAVDESAALAGDTPQILRGDARPEPVRQCQQAIADAEGELEAYRRDTIQPLFRSVTQYKKVLVEEFLVEIPNTRLAEVPRDWLLVNKTKAMSRFRPPRVAQLLQVLNEARERLDAAAHAAWREFVASMLAEGDAVWRKLVTGLSTLDCLLALAQIAKLPGYSRPKILPDEEGKGGALMAVGARHPMVEALLPSGSAFVPNDVTLGCSTADGGSDDSSEHCLIITGPNMGGKSSFMRQSALLVILAQIGSFVPAESMSLRLFDAVHTRMGAADSLVSGRSTFLVEMEETAAILRQATHRSLVILDEVRTTASD